MAVKLMFPIKHVVLGADISRYQASADGKKRFDFDKFIEAGGRWICIRGMIGVKDLDFQFEYNLQQTLDRKIPYCVYHVPKLDKNLKQTVVEWSALMRGLEPPMGEWFDVERNDGNLGKTAYTGNLYKLVDWYSDARSYAPAMYTRAWGCWDLWVERNDWAKKLDLVVANYFPDYKDIYNPPPATMRPWIPNDWGAINNPIPPTIWQFSADGSNNGYKFGSNGDDDIDLDWFIGSDADFAAKYGVLPLPRQTPEPPPVEPPPPPVEPPTDACPAVVNLQEGLRVRSAPYGKILYWIKAGEVKEIYEVAGEDAWARISPDGAPPEWINIKMKTDVNAKLKR